MPMIKLHKLTKLDWCEGSGGWGESVYGGQYCVLFLLLLLMKLLGIALLLEDRHGHANLKACVSF